MKTGNVMPLTQVFASIFDPRSARYTRYDLAEFSTQREFRFMLHEGPAGAKVFVEFLKRLMVNAEKPVLLIVDGHPIHKAKMVKTCVECQEGKHKLFDLPPYSPHLSPDETVWAHVNLKISRQLVERAQGLRTRNAFSLIA
jgi:transposase